MSMAIDTKGVCRTRDRLPGCHQVNRGRLHQGAPGVAYMGPPAHTQVLLFELVAIVRVVVCIYHPNFKCLHPHLRVVSRRERG